MMRSRILFAAAFAVTGCSYFQGSAPTPAGTVIPSKPAPRGAIATMANGASVVRAMHDMYAGKYLKTMSFLQDNTAYTTAGQEQHSQWYEHLEVPGKLRIAFLPSTQKSGLVQVDDRVASFDNGIRVDFRPSVNPLLLLTADVYAAPVATIMRGLDSLHVDGSIIRNDQWQGDAVYVVGAKAGDTTSNQYWIDGDNLRLVRFVRAHKNGHRTIRSDIPVASYKEIQGFEVPTEFVVLRNGKPVW